MTTRPGLNGYGIRPAGDFSNRVLSSVTHPVGVITRLTLNGFGGTIDLSGEHPVGVVTRLTLNGFAGKRVSVFSDRVRVSVPRPVGVITRLSLNGYMARRSLSDKAIRFSGKVISKKRFRCFTQNVGKMMR